MQKVNYKQKDGTVHTDMPKYFTGYKITRDYERISNIVEFNQGNKVGFIKFRPTQTPVIFSVSYGDYYEDRYNDGSVNHIYNQDNHTGQLNGEFRKYDTNGEMLMLRYYHESIDITEDIKSFIKFNGTHESFMTYKFAEDEVFNLYMLYGNKFKFYNEFKRDSSYFTDVMKFCLK